MKSYKNLSELLKIKRGGEEIGHGMWGSIHTIPDLQKLNKQTSQDKNITIYDFNDNKILPVMSLDEFIKTKQESLVVEEKMKLKGIKVLSYFIGSSKQSKLFTMMYGREAKFINPSDISAIANTLNSLFIEDKF